MHSRSPRHVPPRRTRWSVTAMLTYGALSGVVGESFPFSRVPMYAELAATPRPEAAVPVALVDGRRVDLRDFHRFRGPAPEAIEPWFACRDGLGCKAYPSSDPTARAYARHVREHGAAASDPEGPVRVDVGYLLLSERAEGGFDEITEVVWRGTAWPRSD